MTEEGLNLVCCGSLKGKGPSISRALVFKRLEQRKEAFAAELLNVYFRGEVAESWQ